MRDAARVSVVRCPSYGAVQASIRRAVDLIGGFGQFIDSGDRVLIKPNVGRPLADLPTVTDPRFIVALIRQIRSEVRTENIIVAENAVFGYPTSTAFHESGIKQAVERAGATIVALDDCPHRVVHVPRAKVLHEVSIPELMFECDTIVNAPKWKTHVQTDITLCIKNFHGIIHKDYRRMCHTDDLPQKLVDILKIVKPRINIVDGVLGIDGQGPMGCGDALSIGLVAAGEDCVAVDAVCSHIMGYASLEVDTTRIAHYDGLGTGNMEAITVLGEDLAHINISFSKPDLKLVGVYPNVNVILGSVCRGCRSRLKLALEIAKKAGILERMKPITIVCGIDAIIPENDENTVVVGDCTLLRKSLSEDYSTLQLQRRFNESRISGKFVQGCPAWFSTLLDSLFPDTALPYRPILSTVERA
jgi:uncharacterized protein (DUF362 family)